MKFKVGDKVKISKVVFESDKKYEGKVVTIKYVDPYDSDRYKVKENDRPWYGFELEPVEEKEEIILKAIKNEQGFYEIRIPKKIKVYSYGRNRGGYEYINCIKKEEILDDIEKEYLRAVIKPFRDRVEYIEKCGCYEREFIKIVVNDERIEFPYFKKNTMYKGMEKYKEYTLEELGL